MKRRRRPPACYDARWLGLPPRVAVERLLTDNGSAYRSIHFATAALPTYLAYYNLHRRHSALNDAPPASRLPIAV